MIVSVRTGSCSFFWSFMYPRYTNIKKKNICDIATTPPMKNPTAMELWNFLIIIVPPTLNANSINADHIEVNASLRPLVDMTAHDINAKIPVKPKIEYHHPAISLRDEPPHNESASTAVYAERIDPIFLYLLLVSFFIY
eukprot:CAMPEP_0113483562 /NCGR_PEP_ID=MMETSP0014_2-20120614/23498_1 /TAXON_ID=2857 /ORGANISM="Nitzschia sp." /LENGTH=138 /DNA_ID=CAMNT_0000377113 /DNA_START=446 /DNA_END=862 /DNA_ORIENTATION=+ /assembly_acc=CAM_ASM_000159